MIRVINARSAATRKKKSLVLRAELLGGLLGYHRYLASFSSAAGTSVTVEDSMLQIKHDLFSSDLQYSLAIFRNRSLQRSEEPTALLHP